jgi:hypothetical protein
MRFGMALDLWSKTDIHAVPEAEPTAEQKLLQRISEPRVWNSQRGLQVMLDQAVEQGVADVVMEEADWQTLREKVEGRLTQMAKVLEEREAARKAAEAGRAEAVAAVAASHGVAPAQQPAAAPATRPAQAPAAPVAGQQAQVAPQPTGPQAELVAFHGRVVNGWDHLGATEMALAEAKAKGMLTAQMPGPDNRMYQVEALLLGRIAELRQYQQQAAGQPSNAGAVYAAADMTSQQQTPKDERGAA